MAKRTASVGTPHLTPLGRWGLFWTLFLLCTLCWDVTGADMRVMTWLGSTQGFELRENWWLTKVWHDGARHFTLFFYGLLVLSVWRPWGVFKTFSQGQRFQSVLGITLALLVVNLVKRSSLTSCPWELQAFGGVAAYVSHWSWGMGDGGSGFCFPSGHASSAFAFLALTIPWLTSPQLNDRRRGLHVTWFIMILGAILGGVQTLRGAHYPSHTAWTALVCAAVAWGHHLLWGCCAKYLPYQRSQACQQDSIVKQPSHP